MSVLNPRFKFENFVEYKGNRMAKRALETVMENPLIFNPLYIYAETGMGKTHLVSALAHKLREKNYPYLYLIPKELEKQIEKISEFQKGFLIIDDFENFLKIEKEVIEEFTQNFEFYIANEVEIIFSSSIPFNKLKGLPEDFISRIKGGLVIEISKPDEEDRKKIIKEKLKQRGIELEDRFINLMAKKNYKNIREIEGDLNRLFLRYLSKGEITEEDIEEITGITLPILFFSDILPEIEKSLEKLEIVAKEEEALKTALKEKIYIWEMKGFKTDRLKKLIGEKDVNILKEEYRKFIGDVNRLIEYQKLYGEIGENDPEIEQALFDPDRVEEVKKWIEEKMEKIEAEKEEIEPVIEEAEEVTELKEISEIEEVKESEKAEETIEFEEEEIKEEVEEVKEEEKIIEETEQKEEVKEKEEIEEEVTEKEEIPHVEYEAEEKKETEIYIIESEYNREVLDIIKKQAEEGEPRILLIFSPGHRGLSTHLLYAYDIYPSKKKIFFHSNDISDILFEDEAKLSNIFEEYDFMVIDDAEIFFEVQDLSEKIFPLILREFEKGKRFIIGVKKNIDEVHITSHVEKLFEVSEKGVLKKPDPEFLDKMLSEKLKQKNIQIEDEARKEIIEREYYDLKEFFDTIDEIIEKTEGIIRKEHLPWVTEETGETEIKEKKLSVPEIEIENNNYREKREIFDIEIIEERIFEDYP